jgi:hypothetical protein
MHRLICFKGYVKKAEKKRSVSGLRELHMRDMVSSRSQEESTLLDARCITYQSHRRQWHTGAFEGDPSTGDFLRKRDGETRHNGC